MFNYEVMSEAQAMQERFQLLKNGDYEAVIMRSEDRTSSSGNPMMDMTLNVFDENGHIYPVRDFLVFTKTMMWKAIHCADSAGLTKEYEDKKFCSDLVVGKNVRVRITTERGGEIPSEKLNGKPAGSRYPDKNKVEDYVKNENQKVANDFFDDEVISFV